MGKERLEMNKQRRKQISDQIKLIEQAKSNLESILSDEEFSFDNMPENLQGSMRGEESQEAIDIMSEVIDILSDVCDNLENI